MNDAGPGLIDLQVNGYYGVSFNLDKLDTSALHEMCERLLREGVTQILATVVTDHLAVMEARLRRIVALAVTSPIRNCSLSSRML